MKYIFLLIIFFCTYFLSPTPEPTIYTFEKDAVSEVLKKLGDSSIKHYPQYQLRNVSIENGKRLFHTGFATTPKGKRTKKQSKHFVCTSCHNVEREDPDMSIVDPQARLEYAKEKGIPFLQGTTMYGAINRENFYNGDYYKKYGDLVIRARNNIYEAIQLCAVECAQGRKLKQWEMESILAYLWTLELQFDDLILSTEEKEFIENAIKNAVEKDSAIAIIKSKYLKGAPATFIPPPENRKIGETYAGDPQNGKLVYDLSCKHCHENERYSFFALDDSKVSFRHLKKHMPTDSRYSMYQVTRWGTSPLPGKGSYMPHYTKEKMSEQQLQDLRAYVLEQAK